MCGSTQRKHIINQTHCLVTTGCALTLCNLQSTESPVLLHSRAGKYLFVG